jgi:predicted NUDIX family phosphoesterase
MKPLEQVLTFPRRLFDDLGAFQGFSPDHSRYLDAIFGSGALKFVLREDAEKDFTLKQLIPYVLVAREGKVLFYVRGKKTGESRLQLKGSVGVGGHINPVDDSLFSNAVGDRGLYDAAVEREVAEEISLGPVLSKRVVGLINDDGNEVGKVHLGVVHLWEVGPGEVSKAEGGITQLEFLSADEILARKDVEVESWSRYCLESFGAIRGNARSSK